MKLKHLLSIAAIALSANIVALDSEALFKKLDVDGDGYISFDESTEESKVMRNFKKLDKDNDHKISKKEFSDLVHLK
ncbi:EF-hand domain-containing protein [Aliikangiella coralliicola]|uniref:EF-hand domain-containing protein n=1 Tax=Aliikangiella coralliicola TaxID=2592383 RepID=A0A545UHZ3_9GAMM|nr:EF-hand domain-containing protein [Aliikangiella coralliicola]